MSSLLFIIPLALIVVTLQATVVERFAIAGVHPDLVLVGLILLTMISGQATALLAAFVAAILFDVISGLPIGVSILPLFTVVFIANLVERSLFGARLGWPIVVALVSTIVVGLITMAELSILGWAVYWSDTVLRTLAPMAILNAILVSILYFPAEYIRERRVLSLR